MSHGPVERLPACFREGWLADAGELCRNFPGPVQVANGSLTDGAQVNVGRSSPASLLDLGLTVAFDGMGGHVEGLGQWATALQEALGAPWDSVRLMAFANAPGSGLTLHHDVHDQLLVHLEGEKVFRWRKNEQLATPSARFAHRSRPPRAFGADYQQGLPPTPAELAEGLQEVVLRPGSVLFLPGGTWHTTARQQERALSVAVIAEVPNLNQLLLEWIRWHLDQNVAGRARAYGGWPEGEGAEALAAAARGLAAELAGLDPQQPFAAFELARSLDQPARYPSDTAFERYVRLPFAEVMTRRADEGLLVRVRCGGTTQVWSDTTLLTMLESEAVVDWIHACPRAFTVAELREVAPGMPEEELRPLLGALGRAQLVRPLPTPPWGR